VLTTNVTAMHMQLYEAILAVAQPFPLVTSDGQSQKKLLFKPLGLDRGSTEQKLRNLRERLRHSGVPPDTADAVFQTLMNDAVLEQAYQVLPSSTWALVHMRCHGFVFNPASTSHVHVPTRSGGINCLGSLAAAMQAGVQPLILGSTDQISKVGEHAPSKATRQRINNTMHAIQVLFLEVAMFRVLVGFGTAPPHLVTVHKSWDRGMITAPKVSTLLRRLGLCGSTRFQAACFPRLWPEPSILWQSIR
jgi:hypothetical protein